MIVDVETHCSLAKSQRNWPIFTTSQLKAPCSVLLRICCVHGLHCVKSAHLQTHLRVFLSITFLKRFRWMKNWFATNAMILCMDIRICFVATCYEIRMVMCYLWISSIAAFSLRLSIFVTTTASGWRDTIRTPTGSIGDFIQMRMKNETSSLRIFIADVSVRWGSDE